MLEKFLLSWRFPIMNVDKTYRQYTTSPLSEIFSHLGKPCAVPLILALGGRSYNIDVREIRNNIHLSHGMKPSETTISKCLSDLTRLGVVEGTEHAKSPMKAEYSLTSKGQELYRHLIQIRHLTEHDSTVPESFDSISAC